MRVLVYSVTPSPYQRDFFGALARKVELQVMYFEAGADDSPWALGTLEPWESVMHGRVLGSGRVRCHVHGRIPRGEGFDRVIVNAPLTGLTTQRLFRRLKAQGMPWWFWGEELIRRDGLRGWLQSMLARPLSHAEGLVAIGKKAQEDYRRRFPGQRVENIPYACEIETFAKAGEARSPSVCCRFLFAGQMIERKGVDLLLRAFDRLVAEGLDIELKLLGREGGLPDWLEAMSEAGRQRVDYLGFRQPDELPSVFASADVFVLPSRHDGWGVVVNQALAAGMPVIASCGSGAGRDLIEEGVQGMKVDRDNEEALTGAMRSMAERPSERVRMASNARERAHELAPDAAAAKWVTLLLGETGS